MEPEINCLRQEETVIHVEPKVMQVLLQLAEHPKEVVSKESLIQAVWPDTFVSDDVLTRCISVLRRAMQDNAQNPKYVQTIPKAGYRLLIDALPLSTNHRNGASGAPAEAASETLLKQTDPTNAQKEAGPEMHATEEKSPLLLVRLSRSWIILLLAFSTLIFAMALWLVLSRGKNSEEPLTFRTIPFTSYEGQQTQPSFSPNGNDIVFVWDGKKNETRDLYIKQIGSETLHRLTSDAAAEFAPIWSPDGSQIAYMRSFESALGLYLVPSLGGVPRKIYTPTGAVEWEHQALTWSPDGQTLVFPDGKTAQHPSMLYALSLGTLQAKPITQPPLNSDGDLLPAYSPDGKQIAFVRAIEGAVRDIYVLALDGKNSGPRRLTTDNRNIEGLTWARDGKSIIFSSNRGGKYALWRVSMGGGEPSRLPVGTEDSFQPAVSPSSPRLAYTQSSAIWSILSYSLKTNAGVEAHPERVLSSTQQDSAPACSPDGSKVAFQSWRSGVQEIWVATLNPLNLVQMTSFEQSISGSPAWAPDGKQIAFDSRPEGRSHIFVVPVEGGSPRRITDGSFNDILPRWSADGRSIYFSSNRGGSWQEWKIPATGGKAIQVSSHGAFVAAESPDGHWLYYTKPDVSGLWRIPLSGGSEEKILDQPKAMYWGYWNMAHNGIYYLDLESNKPSIDFFDFASGRSAKQIWIEKIPPVYSGISVCSSSQLLLMTDQKDAESHITMVEEFH